jgi:hypothetical protein
MNITRTYLKIKKMLYIRIYSVMPGLTRHPVSNCFYWIPAFAGMTKAFMIEDLIRASLILR